MPADVAIAALRTLLRGVASLEAEDLQAVLVRCAQCNMGGEVKSVAARTVADGTGASPETTALVAALANDPSLARQALQSSGELTGPAPMHCLSLCGGPSPVTITIGDAVDGSKMQL